MLFRHLLVGTALLLLTVPGSAHEIDPQVLLSEHYQLMVDYRGGIGIHFGMPATMAPDDGGLTLSTERNELPATEIIPLYLRLGFTHILPLGLDHVLFVLGLFFLNQRLKPLLWQVTAFTLAHTLTLGMAVAGLLEFNSRWAEALIALSICYVALENLATDKLHPWRPLVVFAFGLLHGIGFASVLGEIGLPENEFFSALISFNVGVELGQLAVIAAAWLLLAKWMSTRWYRRCIVMPACGLIALTGIYWLIERTLL
ncbi:MAG: HupE/UreJ family protein [Porticoccaceae bacterium]|nr:HupE/UreJ family protein [Porticoccaceae bacterium]